MAHCYSVEVDFGGKPTEICTTHVPGNERLTTDIEAGRLRQPTSDEVRRALEYYRSGNSHPRFRPSKSIIRGWDQGQRDLP